MSITSSWLDSFGLLNLLSLCLEQDFSLQLKMYSIIYVNRLQNGNLCALFSCLCKFNHPMHSIISMVFSHNALIELHFLAIRGVKTMIQMIGRSSFQEGCFFSLIRAFRESRSCTKTNGLILHSAVPFSPLSCACRVFQSTHRTLPSFHHSFNTSTVITLVFRQYVLHHIPYPFPPFLFHQ